MFCLRARGQGPRAEPAEALLQAERAEGVEQPGGVLKVNVVPGRAGLPVPTLKEKDFLCDAGGGCGGQAVILTWVRRPAGMTGPSAVVRVSVCCVPEMEVA
jgi:hypothetical protein